jgi:hypothetical protein
MSISVGRHSRRLVERRGLVLELYFASATLASTSVRLKGTFRILEIGVCEIGLECSSVYAAIVAATVLRPP